MPYKVWAIGEEVLAQDFQDYLQEQIVAVFATTAARDAAILTPNEGQLCYVTATKRNYQWNGAAWATPTVQPLGIVASGPNGNPAANAPCALNTVISGPTSWLAANTITLPAGAGGLYLIQLAFAWRSDAIVGIRGEVVNGANASYNPTMIVSVSHNASTWDPCVAHGTWIRQCADGDTFRVLNRGNAQPAGANYHRADRLSITRIGDALAASVTTQPAPPTDEPQPQPKR